VGGGTFGITSGSPSASNWQGPVGFLCLGLFLALVGMVLWRRDGAETAQP
jgi:hypothetical protein